jgi:hypothetical protein
MFTTFRIGLFVTILFAYNNISLANLPECGKKHHRTEQRLKSLEIKVDENRSWQINSIRIITDSSHLIPNKLKKKFNSKIIFHFYNSPSCELRAKMRVHGNFKDHIFYKDGKIFQSLDVSLLSGNINNITKFKLLLKETRGNFEDEIFITELLRSLDFLAPRTKIVNVKLDQKNIEMIFQEKISKEFLEFNKRREGPILEGDEKYMMKYASRVKNNPGINWYEIHEQFKLGKKIQLSKQTNSSWSIKNQKFTITSLDALSKLNQIYLEYMYNFSFDNNAYSILDYNMNNYLLSQGNKKKELRLNIFNNLVLAANGHHMFYGNNRKFYWNSFEGFFEPIYYDGNLGIDKKFSKLNKPFSADYDISIKKTKLLINQINKDNFYEQLSKNNLSIKKEKVLSKFRQININLDIIEEIFLENKKEEFFNINFKNTNKLTSNYNDNLNAQQKNIKLVKFDTNLEQSNFSFFLCEKFSEKCLKKIDLDNVQIRKLLEGNFILNNNDIQFFSRLNNVNKDFSKIKFDNEFFNDVTFYYNNGVNYTFDKANKTFSINQISQTGRAYFVNGSIKNISIKFNGDRNFFEKKNLNQYDHRTLTGCLSIINVELKKLEISSINSNCEDGINIIKSKGHIKKLKSQNSLFDGIDLDFSNLLIENVEVGNSLNDCIDFSGGDYQIKNSYFTNCGDKGISVGENSLLNISQTKISSANIGIASKDSSKIAIENSDISETENCLAAYNKKQEFGGGEIVINNSLCKKFLNANLLDEYSKIEIKNNL